MAGGSRLRAVTARAGAESGSNGRRSLGSRSSHKEAVLSRTNSIASTKRQKDSFGALAVCVYLYAGLSSSSSSSSTSSLFSLASSLPAVSSFLSYSYFTGALRWVRDAATPQECPASPPRAYLYSLLLSSPVRSRFQPRIPKPLAAASYRADKDGLKLAPCRSADQEPAKGQQEERRKEKARRQESTLSLWFSSACAVALFSLSLSLCLLLPSSLKVGRVVFACALRCLFSRENAVRMHARTCIRKYVCSLSVSCPFVCG